MERFTSAKKMVGLLTVLVAAGLFFTARPVLAFWNQLQGGQALQPYLYNLPPQSGGFACLTQPLSDPAEREVVSRAVGQLEQSIRLLPNQAHPYYLLGRAYCRLGDYAAAVRFLPRFSELRPKNPQADFELGFALEKLCPPAGECEELTTAQVWQRAGVLPEHLIANGEAARKQEDFEQALAWYRRAQLLGADLRSTMAYLEYQRALKEEKQEEAYAALQRAVELDAGWADADMRFLGWYRYGQWIYEKNEYQLAERILYQAIQYFNGSNSRSLSHAFRMLGVSQYILRKYEDALKNLEEAIQINPKNIWGYISYGRAIYEQNDKDVTSADYYFKLALGIDPKDEQIWRNIINFWKDKKEVKKFEEYCFLAEAYELRIESCKR